MRLRLGTNFTGASDHLVSEAIYLDDPEGNGIEVYADRPSATWTRIQDAVQMGVGRLDLVALTRSTPLIWKGMPMGGTVGHVHLQVGDVHAADSFYGRLLGFAINAMIPTARFYSTGGYHHQIAGNIWQSARAGARPDGIAGLAEVELLMRDAATLEGIAGRLDEVGKSVRDDASRLIAFDPWNIRLAMRRT